MLDYPESISANLIGFRPYQDRSGPDPIRIPTLLHFWQIEIADIQGFLEKNIGQMLNENTTRRDFAEKLQWIINRYNPGGSATEEHYQKLLAVAPKLAVEDERLVRENLKQEELELFDLLKKPNLAKP